MARRKRGRRASETRRSTRCRRGWGCRRTPRLCFRHVEAEQADDEAREQRHEDARHERGRQQLPVQEAAVRQAVDDVERRLERAEERQRRPEQADAADDPERRGVVLDAADERDDAVERRAGERALQLADEEVDASTRCARPKSESARKIAARRRAARSTRPSPRDACRGRRKTSRELAAADLHTTGVCTRLLASRPWSGAGPRGPRRDLAADRGGGGIGRATVARRLGGRSRGRRACSPRHARELVEAPARSAAGASASRRSTPSSRRASLRRREARRAHDRRGHRGARAAPGLLFYDLKRCLAASRPRRPASEDVGCSRARRAAASGALAGACHDRGGVRRRRATRLDVYFDDGSFVTYVERIARGGAAAPTRAAGARGGAVGMNDAELREALVAAAYLEGDFLLRSGKRSRYYLDKYRFETRPDLLGAARRADRRRRARARARGRPARRAGARRRVARRRGVARVGPAVPHGPGRGEGVRDGEPHRGRSRRARPSASSRTS